MELAFRLWLTSLAVSLLGTALVFAFTDPLAEARQAVSTPTATDSTSLSDSVVTTIFVVTAVFGVLFLALQLFLLFKVRGGRNWARVTLTVLTALAVASTVFNLATQEVSVLGVVPTVVSLLLETVGIVLLYRPASNAYFTHH